MTANRHNKLSRTRKPALRILTRRVDPVVLGEKARQAKRQFEGMRAALRQG
jgi:hypothetical protein